MSGFEDHVDVVGLLTGELRNAEVVAAGRHLEACEQCREELAETAVGHAVLRHSTRFLGEAPADERAAEPGLPPLTLPPAGRIHLRGRNRVVLVAAAAVVGVTLGGATVLALTNGSDDTSVAPPPPVATAQLGPVEGADPGATGEVEMHQGDVVGHTQMTLHTANLPPAGSGHYYYAWLLDPATLKMLPLGQVGPEGGSFDIGDSTLGAYSAVDVSLEADDGDPGHSVTSVLRGTY